MPLIPLLLAAGVAAAPWSFDRVDLVSEGTGTWVNYELPQAVVYPTAVGLRWVEQVQVVLDTPVPGLKAGLGLASQSVLYERPLFGALDLSWSAGVDTRLGVPRAVRAGLAWRWWRLRLGVGLVAVSGAAWDHPDWSFWRLLPTVGVGVGRRWEPGPAPDPR